MSDPRRLLEDEELGGLLLRAGRDVDASRAHERRIALLGAAAGVAVAAAAKTASAGTAAGKGLLPPLLAKWLAIGAMASAAGVGGWAIATSGDGPPAPAVAAPQSGHVPERAANEAPPPAPAQPPPAIEPPAAEAPAVEAPASEVPRAAAPQAKRAARPAEERPAHAAPAPPADEKPAAEGAPFVAPGLADEVAALRAAREALGAGRAKAALSALDTYFERFPGGRLALEAEVLRIEALAQSGQTARAAALARSFLSARPSSPYAHRVRAIAGVSEDAATSP